jgi:hypothetical protein
MRHSDSWSGSSSPTNNPASESIVDSGYVGAAVGADSALDLYAANWENAWIDIGGEG